MSKERRLNNRMNVHWTARIGGRGLGVAAARIKDASIGGVQLITTLDIEVGYAVIVELEISAEKKLSLINSKIARKEELVGGKLFSYGVQFLKLDDDALQYLLRVCS